MKAILPIGIVVMVLAFLLGTLNQFPFDGTSAGADPPSSVNTEEFSKELVEETAQRFSSAYAWVVQDLVSYQRRPNYERAELQRQAMVDYANTLVPQLKDLADQLQGKLDELAPAPP